MKQNEPHPLLIAIVDVRLKFAMGCQIRCRETLQAIFSCITRRTPVGSRLTINLIVIAGVLLLRLRRKSPGADAMKLRLLAAVCLFATAVARCEAGFITYSFDSDSIGLHGEITFDDTSANFAASHTATADGGGIVSYFFERNTAFWDLFDNRDTLFISFAATGNSPDDIFFYGLNTFDTAPLGMTSDALNFNTDFTVNGEHQGSVTTGSTRLTFTDGQFSTPVPEPSSALLFTAGCGILALVRRRRHVAA